MDPQSRAVTSTPKQAASLGEELSVLWCRSHLCLSFLFLKRVSVSNSLTLLGAIGSVCHPAGHEDPRAENVSSVLTYKEL